MNEVAGKVRHIVGAHLGLVDDEVKDNLYLKDDLNTDTLALADIAVALEDEFHLDIPQEELVGFNTVGDIVTFVTEKLNEL